MNRKFFERLKNFGVIVSYKPVEDSYNYASGYYYKIRMSLVDGREIIVAYLMDYFVGKGAVIEACKKEPIPNVIVYSAWQQWVDGAKEAAKTWGIPVKSISEFENDLINHTNKFGRE